MNYQDNNLQRLDIFSIVKKSMELDLFKATDFLIQQGYLTRGKGTNPDSFLCIYHDEKTPSFSRSKRHSKLRCFGCGKSVLPLQVYADYLIKERFTGSSVYLPEKQQSLEKNFIRWEAAILLCYNLGEISESERDYQFNQLNHHRSIGKCIDLDFLETHKEIITEKGDFVDTGFTTRNNGKGVNTHEIALNKIEDFKKIEIASREELHIVYSFFIQAIEMTRGYRLFDKHKLHLLNKRRLSEYEINQKGYFSHPLESEKASIMSNLINLLIQNGINPQVLNRVPGFYFNQYTNCFEMGTSYDDVFFIPLLDLYGNTHRLQIRTESKVKYCWFSVKGAGNCKTPTSTLFPIDKNYLDLASGNMIPSTNMQECFRRYLNEKGIVDNIDWNKEVVIIISEGHFKSYELAKHFNCICISIQGLNTWDCAVIALIKIQNMLRMYNKRITKVIIAFDSDIKIKKGLFDNGEDFSSVIRNESIYKNDGSDIDQIRFLEGVECFYLEWNDKLGKGFDDVLHNGYSNEVFSISKDIDCERKHRVIVSLIAKLLRKHTYNITTEDLSVYYDKLSQNHISILEERLEKINLIDSIINAKFKEQLNQVDINLLNNITMELNNKSIYELQQILNSFNLN